MERDPTAQELHERFEYLDRNPDATWLDLIDAGLLDSGALLHPERVLPLTIDSRRVDLVNEFRRAPLGPHSPELTQLLWILRSRCPNGRYVLVTRGEQWATARIQLGRRSKLEYVDNELYSSREDAEWAVFALRWRDHTGTEPPLDPSENQ